MKNHRHVRLLTPPWQADSSKACPCGSGFPYRECCSPNTEMVDKFRDYFNKGDYPAAEKSARATLTRYVGWVYQHTLMLLAPPTPAGLRLAHIDVGALEDFAQHIAWVLDKQSKREGILHTFDHIAATVPLPCLSERMAYLKCLWLLHRLEQPALAERVLSAWPSHEKITDYRLLQLYLEMRGDSVSVGTHIEIVNRILVKTESPVEQLHYSSLKGMLLFLIGEHERAKTVHSEAMGRLFEVAVKKATNQNCYAYFTCADALEFQGELSADPSYTSRALSLLDQLDPRILATNGTAELHYRKGDLHLKLGQPEKAVSCFSSSHALNGNPLSLIYRLDAFLQIDDVERAKADLDQLRRMTIPPHCRLEFLRSATRYSIRVDDLEGVRGVLRELKELDLQVPEFRIQREELCVLLLEFLQQPHASKSKTRIQVFLDKVRRASEYLELKPNFCGLGLNLNRFLQPKDNQESSGPTPGP